MNITKNGGISRNLKIFKGKRRKGLSELVGTLAMVSITLVAGAAVFGWINGQANSSETAYGVSVANNINFLRERFVVVTQSFSTNGGSCSGSCNQLSFWAYNDGQITFSLLTVRIQNLTDIPSGAVNKNPLNILFYAGSASACSLLPPPDMRFRRLQQGRDTAGLLGHGRMELNRRPARILSEQRASGDPRPRFDDP